MAKSKANAKAGKKNVFAVILALVFLAGCAFCGAGIGLRDKTSGKWYSASSWFHRWGKSEKPGETGTPTSSAVISEGESNGIALLCEQIPVEAYSAYGITRQSADSYYSLSVEYEPANTTFQETDITVSFKNPNSTWASGKNLNNYVSINHEDEATTATLYILKGFEEQIIITARSQRIPSLYAKATVDWLHTSINGTISDATDIEGDIEMSLFKFSGGTIEPDREDCIEIRFEALGFKNFMESKGFSYSSDDQIPASDTCSYYFSYDEDMLYGYGFTNPKEIIIKLIGEHYQDNPKESWDTAREFFLNGQKPENCSGNYFVSYTILFHRKYNGKEIDIMDSTCSDLCIQDWSGFEIKATDINLKPSDIVGW